MILSDPIGDMLTRIRNGLRAGHAEVMMPGSKMKCAVAEVLKTAGYIRDYTVAGEKPTTLTIVLKYLDDEPVIEGLRRISKPSRRVYVGSSDIPRVQGGLGVALLSTSNGIMSDRTARKANVGGEVLCYVW
jgi:small subunit ribosomal protein S8